MCINANNVKPVGYNQPQRGYDALKTDVYCNLLQPTKKNVSGGDKPKNMCWRHIPKVPSVNDTWQAGQSCIPQISTNEGL